MSRHEVLERIHAAHRAASITHTATPSPHGAPVSTDLPILPAPQTFADPAGLFVDRARQVGVRVEIVASMSEAVARTAVCCGERGARRAAVWDVPDLAPVVERIRAAGIDVVQPGASVEAVATADVGITSAAWGVAETATLVLPAGPGQPRLFSLLPPAHLAILQADRIVPDLPALFARCGALPSALTLITGPSRSADIGLVPVLGAHGPMEVTIVLISP